MPLSYFIQGLRVSALLTVTVVWWLTAVIHMPDQLTVVQKVWADVHQRWLGERGRQDKKNSYPGQAARWEQSKTPILGEPEVPRSAWEESSSTSYGSWVLLLRYKNPSPNRLESQGVGPGRVWSLGVYGTRDWTSLDLCRNLLHQIMWKQNPSGFGVVICF